MEERKDQTGKRLGLALAVLAGTAVAGLALLLLCRFFRGAPGKPPGSPPAASAASAAPAFADLPVRLGSRHGLKLLNAHEHLDRRETAALLRGVMDRAGVEQTVLLGSPRHTLEQSARGFTLWRENNEALFAAARDHPGRFLVFPTLDPRAPDAATLPAAWAAAGARGIKLYLGHGGDSGGEPFHVRPLDDPALDGFYDACAARGMILLYHVNLNRFGDELERLFDRHPKLFVILPHYGLWTLRLENLADLLRRRARLWLDISFGAPQFARDGLGRISRRAEEFRAFFLAHAERLLFGTDAVVTAGRSARFLERNLQAYVEMLEERWYGLDAGGRQQVLRGLELPPEVLRLIYRENLLRLLEEAGRAGRGAGASH